MVCKSSWNIEGKRKMKNNLFETNEEITEILKSHGLYQITLHLPFRLNHVNCFMSEGEKSWKIKGKRKMKNNLFDTYEEITEILKSHGLYQITLPLPFRLNHVNCFMAEGEKGWKIIDTGLHNKETVARWEQMIPQKEITDIIITHYQPDHY